MQPDKNGFTLIELSIVLVIIGLIVGGVLVGQDLIRAAGVRATISQIEKYNTAVNTFRGKYGALPGDMNAVTASSFGFASHGPNDGQGDGNGVIQGLGGFLGPGASCGFCPVTGETAMFWVDITSANGMNLNLIDGSFDNAGATTQTATTTIDRTLPQAKIGKGNYIYVWSGGVWPGQGTNIVGDGTNYFGLSVFTSFSGWALNSRPGLTVQEASTIDRKLDDGSPQTGRVRAWYYNYALENYTPSWAAGGGVEGANTGGNSPTTAATPGSSTTCYDNSTSANGQTAANGNPQHYSLEISAGAEVNCALSFQFQ